MPQVITERENGHRRVQTVNEEESMTVQSDHHRADIKEILRAHDQTGIFIGLRQVDLAFKDVSEFEDYADMMLQSREAEAAFMRLPSKVREVFGHDHLNWLDAAHETELDPEMRSKLEKLGYLKPEDVPQHQNRTADGQFASGSHDADTVHAPGDQQDSPEQP